MLEQLGRWHKRGMRYGLFLILTALLSSGCGSYRKCCDRHTWYQTKQRDVRKMSGSVDKAQKIINKSILASSEKLGKSLQPDYLVVSNAGRSCGEPAQRSSKKVLAVVDIYATDKQGMRMLEGYITDVLVASILSDPTIGENFRVGERHRLTTLLRETDLRSLSDFDARDAIRKNAFRGADAVLVGSLYTMPDRWEPNKKGKMKRVSKGSCSLILRVVDTTEADVVSTAVEAVPYNRLVSDWIDRVVVPSR